ncbi:hypothetical protein GCM10010401_12960 [Rarobacter faecitabidus]|uniref:alpha-amylase n=1 Tax=Rarobacter faecitabidus TaxID=13243 RepID=A0A542ZE79_RARFA|nr:carboxypeptidase-like regulatory domain-containing protein [Rarobacter faecitabidus]TQL58655.1 carboxypeptidase family protein [Rarobacter faecitabidus]
MHIDVSPRALDIHPPQSALIAVTLTNTSDVIIGARLRVLGADSKWITIDDAEPRLFPGETSLVTIEVTVPPELPAGTRTLAIQVQDVADPASIEIAEVALNVPADPRLTLTVDPPHVTAGKRAQYTAIVANTGNATQNVSMTATDPKAKTTFRFTPSSFILEPGGSMPVAVAARARRPLFGDATLRPFQVTASGTPSAATPTPPATAVFVQKSLISRGAITLVGLLLAVSIFALVIVIALSSVVDRSAADRNLALTVAQAREAGAATGSSGLGGKVVDLMTGSFVSSVAVAAFPADDASNPIATTASGDDGSFAISGLPAGDYLVRVQGGGYDEVWYPAAASPGDAQTVTLANDQRVADLTVVVGGTPASLAGEVSGDDVAGATLTIQLPLDAGILADAGMSDTSTGDSAVPAGAVVTTAPIGSDSTFEVTNLPSPAIYDLIISKPGLASTVQRLDVAAGENRTGIKLSLLAGDGIIEGTVSGDKGPIGEATIVASSSDVTVRTVSLTEGDVGSFVLRGLPTPGNYTITVAADGYSSATLALSLTQGQHLEGVSAVLGTATGSLSGLVSVDSGSAAGVEVIVTDGATTLRSVTQSTSPVGAWRVTGLRIPATYTVTFTKQGLTSQVVSVRIDGFGRVTQGATSATTVNATMGSATASLKGTVSQRSGQSAAQPVGNVTITLSSGDTQRVVTSASSPSTKIGQYLITGLRPGTYTVTFARQGTTPTSAIITLTAGETEEFSPVLVAPASISGTVTHSLTGDPAPGLTVNLYLASQYGTAADPVAVAVTDSSGSYAFNEVDAPEHYIVEVRTAPGSTVVATSPPISLAASDVRQFNANI